jgi:cell fate (sporulation/competence/biofilm development) regulator YlbF (YheA/YmcA/DUF963 family)
MSDTAEILKKARGLGEAIASHARVAAMHSAQQKVQLDQAAQKLLRDYQDHANLIRRKESEGQPIEPREKHKLADLERGMASNDALKTMMRAQADYLDLMNQVHDAIEASLAEKTPSSPTP